MKMNHYARCVTAGIVCTLMYGNLFAQETFDLSSQRSEKQDVRAVPGEKVDHKGFVLNPQPHQFTPIAGKTCDISQGVVPVDPLQRAWREACGRALIYLAQEAGEVYRVFCGLPERLK